MPNGVTKETFERADTDSKLNILFDQQTDIVKSIKDLKGKDTNLSIHYSDQWAACDRRFKGIEKSWYKLTGAVLLLAIVVPILSQIILKYFI